MKLHIYFDYTCPFCYIAASQLDAVIHDFPEIALAWRPFELRPKPTTRPVISPDPETGESWDPALTAAAEDEGLKLCAPFSPLPYTDRAFHGMHIIESAGGDARLYNERVFKAVFEQGRDISDMNVLTDIAREIGANADAFNSKLREGAMESVHQNALKHAYFESGVEEIPTFKLMGLRISGAVGRAVMEKFLGDGLKEKQKSEKAANQPAT